MPTRRDAAAAERARAKARREAAAKAAREKAQREARQRQAAAAEAARKRAAAGSEGPRFNVQQTQTPRQQNTGGSSAGSGGGPGTPTRDMTGSQVAQPTSSPHRNDDYNWDLLGDPDIGEAMDRQQWNDLYRGMPGMPTYDEIQRGQPSGAQYYGALSQQNAIEGNEQIKPVTEVKWKEGSFTLESAHNGSAPDWWKPLIPDDPKDMERPDVAYAAMLNTMIPYMSIEDQRRAAGDIYTLLGGGHFGKYHSAAGAEGNVPITKLQADLGAEGQVIDSEYFQSRARATGAINALSQLREQTVQGNREDIGGTGGGYRWLQNALEQALTYGGGASRKKDDGADQPRQSRAQYLAMQGALDPIMAQASGMGPVGSIGHMLMTPFFSQGPVRGIQQTQGGHSIFGQPNALLFG